MPNLSAHYAISKQRTGFNFFHKNEAHLSTAVNHIQEILIKLLS